MPAALVVLSIGFSVIQLSSCSEDGDVRALAANDGCELFDCLGLTVAAPSFDGAELRWTQVPFGTHHFQIHRNGRLIDRVGSEARDYTDYLLWESTTYVYTLTAADAAGAALLSQSALVTTPARGTASFPRPYSAKSPWNTRISDLRPTAREIDPDSGRIVAYAIDGAMTKTGGDPNLATGDTWGLPIAYSDESSRRYRVGCTDPVEWPSCEARVFGRIPGYAQANAGSDGKLTVIETGAKGEFVNEIDAWQAVHSGIWPNDTWSATTRFTADPNGSGYMCGRGRRCGGPNAAGNTNLAGVVRPEEIAQGHIDHALQLAVLAGVGDQPHYVRGPRGHGKWIACPATNSDGDSTNPYSIPEGARIRLRPSFPIPASWAPWQRTIARALMTYGAIVDDKGGSFSIMAESNLNRGYDAWRLAGKELGPTTGNRRLGFLPWAERNPETGEYWMQILRLTRNQGGGNCRGPQRR